MTASLVGLLGVVAAVLLGALTEAMRARSTFRRDKAWHVLEERRRRIEETYEAAVGPTAALILKCMELTGARDAARVATWATRSTCEPVIAPV